MDLEAFRWLLGDDGQRLLARAEEEYAAAEGDPVRAVAAVRRLEPDGDRTAAALTQAGLRARAVEKFGDDAWVMYFTPDALEQATRSRVATHRAARLAAAAPASVVDLGCGLGGDLIAFARAGLTAAGVDLDPVRVAVAEANLAALGLAGAVQVADATQLDVSGFGAVFADPARRGGRGRVFDAEGWTPPWSFVRSLLTRAAVVKVAPGIPHDLVPDGVEAEWVSEGGEVKEAALWSSYLATCARRATVIGRGGLATLTEEDDPYVGEPRPVRPLGRFLFEPDGAVIRAGLVTAVAAGVHGGLVDEHIAYVTGDEAFRSPFARGYEVLETLPYRERPLRAALHARGVGRLTIKKRGVDVVPEQLRKRLDLRGENEATLVLTRIAGDGAALLVRPL
ncbi:class I SAM-dependent methyltransferase [Nocardioides donggukensis]|uniref:Methyltransferase domain-containing protein n=1 Tax=Nocardioides donggukensis TaxID=2774019 RepID=A0A927K2F0_9ACTN|nr:class I SAM-dependent methyltransferase [Nocardioides donggukensis]MBD8868552.1 methyltransferase domain-containing protein [Nocardioides donggukensis]